MGPRAASRVWWGERALGEMLREQLQIEKHGAEKRYNEVIIDAFDLRKHLPHAIEAIFFIGVNAQCQSENHWANANGHCESFARAAHEAFLKHFGVSANEVPLLRLDVHANVASPFALADDPWSDTFERRGKELLDRICLVDLSASAVQTTSRSCQPQLWVYEGQGNLATVRKTRASVASGRIRWDGERLCVSLAPRTDRRTCFDIRDAASTAPPPRPSDDDEGEEDGGGPTLLHFGCTTLTARSAVVGGRAREVSLSEYTINHKPPATLRFRVVAEAADGVQ